MNRGLYRDTNAWADLGAFAHAVALVESGAPPHPLLAAASGLNEAVPSEAGFVVPTEFAAELWQRATTQGAILSRVTPQPMVSNSIKLPAIDETSRATGSRWGGVRGYWLNEADAATATRPKFRAIQLEPRKVVAAAWATDELLADREALGAWLERTLASELLFQVEAAIVAGDGVTKPLGYLNAPATIELAPESGQASGSLVAANLKNMLARTWVGSRSSLAWVIHPDLEGALLTMESGGAPLFHYGDDGTPRLLGRPVIAAECASPPGDRGDVALVDLRQYVLTERPAEFTQSMHLRFMQGESLFRLSARVDGQPAWASAITPYSGSIKQSPFVVLGARA